MTVPTARRSFAAAAALAVCALIAPGASAQTAYGVSSTGSLFRFNVAAPGAVTTIGNLGFTPEGIDFRPGTGTLYAVDVGPATTRLFTVNTDTGAATQVGAGFASAGATPAAYDLTTATSFGFDFNPTTLQADGSIRIRLVGNNRADLRLNSDTGAVAAVDGQIAYAAGDVNAAVTPSVVGSAYINSAASTQGGTTVLYNVDTAANALVTQNPPNNGTLNTVGALGADVQSLAGFDIFTAPGSADATIGGDTGYLVATVAGNGTYQLYTVDLGTGALGAGQAVGGGLNFDGGFAVVPEPASAGLLGLAATAVLARRRRPVVTGA
jgi:hypothetical protein